MPLRECIQRHTYREYKLWMDFLEEEWYRTTPTQWYLMQIAQEVRRVLCKKPNKIKIKDFLLKFKYGSKKHAEQKPGESEESLRKRLSQAAKAKWGMAVGLIKPGQKDAHSRHPRNKADRRGPGPKQGSK